jgi:hypothetical protein
MCAVLHVNVSGYRACKRGGIADRQGLSDTQLLVLIQSIHAELKGPMEAHGWSVSCVHGAFQPVRHGSSG